MTAPLQVIEVPDILPNNLKKLRVMRNKTTHEIANAISLKHSYITTIENQKVNMSGITAISIMEYLDVSFYQLFDTMKSMILPYSTNGYEKTMVKINVEEKHLQNISGKDIKNINAKNLIYIEEKIYKKLKLSRKESNIKSFDLVDINSLEGEGELVAATFNVVLLNKIKTEKEFNINFSAEMNYDLFEELSQKDFIEKKSIILDKDDFNIINDKILITNHSKILKKGKPKSFNLSYEINDDIKFTYDENKNIVSIRIDVLYESKNHFKYIEARLGMTSLDVQNALDVTQKSYYQIINGNSMLSTKMMWRLARLFKIPLEIMFNIPYYLETHKRS